MKHLHLINRILLGLVMLVPGLFKLWVMVSGETFVVDMLAEIGLPGAVFFAWLLLLVEIVTGIAILVSWKLEYVVWGPVVILVVAAFTTWIDNVSQILVHLALASSYLLLAKGCCRPNKSMDLMKPADTMSKPMNKPMDTMKPVKKSAKKK